MSAETLSEKIADIVKPQISSGEVVKDTDSSPKEVVKELKEILYGSKDISNFEEFLREGYFPVEGEHTFSVDSKYLRYACGVLKYINTGSKVAENLIKVTVFENQLKLSGFNQTSFGEVFVPLTKISSVGKNPEISLVFDYPTLAKIVASFEKEVLNFTFSPEKALLVMDSGNAHLELSTREGNDFIQFHNKIKEIKPVACTLNHEILQTALEYLSLFLRKDSQPNLSLLECRDSTMLGGNYASIGIFHSSTLSNVPLKLKYEVVQVLNKVLPYFYPSKMKLFETDGFYILRDQNLYLGIEKTDVSFPSLKHLLSIKIEESYTIPRKEFLSSLYKISAVSGNKDVLIQFKLSGSPPTSLLTLSIQDPTGRKSRDVIPIVRQNINGTFDEHFFYVPLDALIKTISFFKSPEVFVQEIPGKAILIKDTQDIFTTNTILSSSKDVN